MEVPNPALAVPALKTGLACTRLRTGAGLAWNAFGRHRLWPAAGAAGFRLIQRFLGLFARPGLEIRLVLGASSISLDVSFNFFPPPVPSASTGPRRKRTRNAVFRKRERQYKKTGRKHKAQDSLWTGVCLHIQLPATNAVCLSFFFCVSRHFLSGFCLRTIKTRRTHLSVPYSVNSIGKQELAPP